MDKDFKRGAAVRCEAGHGRARPGPAWHGVLPTRGWVKDSKCGGAGLGVAWQGWAWHGVLKFVQQNRRKSLRARRPSASNRGEIWYDAERSNGAKGREAGRQKPVRGFFVEEEINTH